MSFAEVIDWYSKLRIRLVALVGPEALPEINISIPKDTGSELAFLRLVGWSYALFHENGKLAVKFLLRLGNEPLPEALENVRVLRTWVAHNLSLEKARDGKMLRSAWAWLRRSCGVTTPDENHWGKCFAALLSEVSEVVRKCIAAAEVLDHPVDGPRNVGELKRRVDREWDAHRFDRFVEEAAARFGFRGIEAVTLRSTKLDSWRKVVQMASEEEIDALLTKRIESDILELMGEALPLVASEIVDKVSALPPAGVALWMMALKRREPMNASDFADVLVELGNAMLLVRPEEKRSAEPNEDSSKGGISGV
jgi:hypothetical protein